MTREEVVDTYTVRLEYLLRLSAMLTSLVPPLGVEQEGQVGEHAECFEI